MGIIKMIGPTTCLRLHNMFVYIINVLKKNITTNNKLLFVINFIYIYIFNNLLHNKSK